MTTAQQTAETALRAYEQLGRELPDDIATWTPAQRQQMRAARDAYYAALKALNASHAS
jgi:hypothetical protein